MSERTYCITTVTESVHGTRRGLLNWSRSLHDPRTVFPHFVARPSRRLAGGHLVPFATGQAAPMAETVESRLGDLFATSACCFRRGGGFELCHSHAPGRHGAGNHLSGRLNGGRRPTERSREMD